MPWYIWRKCHLNPCWSFATSSCVGGCCNNVQQQQQLKLVNEISILIHEKKRNSLEFEVNILIQFIWITSDTKGRAWYRKNNAFAFVLFCFLFLFFIITCLEKNIITFVECLVLILSNSKSTKEYAKSNLSITLSVKRNFKGVVCVGT